MQAALARPLDVMSVVTDRTNRKSEVIDVNQVFVVSEIRDHDKQLAQFVVAFGGKDSTGKLHICPIRRQKMTQITIPPDLYAKYFNDSNGNPRRGILQADLDELFAEHIVPSCDRLAWGMESVHVVMDGELIYSKDKDAPALCRAQLRELAAKAAAKAS